MAEDSGRHPLDSPPRTGRSRRRRTRRGTGSVFRRGRVWWIKYFHRGVHRQESAGTPEKREAERLLARRLDEIGAERLGVRPFVGAASDRLTVDEMLDASLSAYCIARNLDRAAAPPSMSSHSKPIRTAFGAMRAAEVREEEIDRYVMERRRAGKAPATINRELQILQRAFRVAVGRKRLASAPMIPRLRENNARRGFFEHRAFEALVAALPDDLKDFTRFAYITGWRKGEIASLKWSDVDREGGAIRLRPEASKNGHGRIVPIEIGLTEIVARRWAARTIDRGDRVEIVPWVFHRDGRPVAYIKKSWRSACRAAGLEGRLFHDLRRTAVRNMVRANVKEGPAMAISGHRTRAVFDRYNITSEADLRDAIRRTVTYTTGRGNRGRPSAAHRSHRPDYYEGNEGIGKLG